MERIGLWLVGAAGGVGSTTALGVSALARGLVGETGLVTGLPAFTDRGLPRCEQIVVGGHEVRAQSLLSAVRAMHETARVFDDRLIESCATDLRRFQRDIRPGVALGSSDQVRSMADNRCIRRVSSAARAVEVIRGDLVAFRRRRGLSHVVVVNVASSEAPPAKHRAHATYAALSKAMLNKGQAVVPSSALYALGALASGCSYVNFTPSVGMNLPAVKEFADQQKALYMGRDGKTGETLLKSVVAPMFTMRNLRLSSWIGHNVLGNRDGAVLEDPAVKVSKIRSKDGVVSSIVGYSPDTQTSIEYAPSLGDWKVAWDYIHFEGFLNTSMSLQFVWTGCDSVLAAPLVIDLVRLTALEHRLGRTGRMDHLALFFKDPDGVREQRLSEQWRRLLKHVTPEGSRRLS